MEGGASDVHCLSPRINISLECHHYVVGLAKSLVDLVSEGEVV